MVESYGLSINSRALYTIQLQGVLDPNWSDRLGGMEVLSYAAETRDRSPVTTLISDVADQAALAGVLSTVHMLGQPLLSVTYLGQPGSNDGFATLID